MRTRVLFSIACLAVVTGGVRFAVAKERFRSDALLQNEYRAINQEYYGGSLPDVPVMWDDLPADRIGETYVSDDGASVIKLDPRGNLDIDEVRSTLKHESCHVYANDEVTAGIMHGSQWRECMQTRFPDELTSQ
jgi:hypothetical protein